ncbi:MAG: LysR family transcriptional regulator [Silicimonas sp.]|nr:LysR family transcriptional regulator [Silicimonas sp.]NNL35133.1 LysR family transcriptional regulator [Silicimonas sp.]NNL72114.1 LysR family transcriptional regulator [Silicimonas sp.]RZW11479.1 MAG: LysR family transcriptional regulator [Paracoccaceae bacterium]
MDTQARTDWSLLQSFLVVAERGSLSAAARRLGKTQPTIGRHIQLLERDLDVKLFRRQARGMVMTEQGEALLEHARAMRTSAEALNLAAAGKSSSLAGTVRITASVFVSHHVMPAILAEIREAHPEIKLELVASDQSENLLFREADIAVRMYRPQQLDMVALKLGSIELGLWGASSYLDRVGRPSTMVDAMECDFVGYDRNEEIILGFREAGFAVGRDFFGTRCDNQTAYWELVRAGCGLGFGSVYSGDSDPSMERVALDIAIPKLEVWLTAHEALRHTPRVDAVWRVMATRLREVCNEAVGSS